MGLKNRHEKIQPIPMYWYLKISSNSFSDIIVFVSYHEKYCQLPYAANITLLAIHPFTFAASSEGLVPFHT